jgi:uncharacterized protein YyaL (SSP411 family)
MAVKIVGEPARTDEFREAGLRLPSPVVAVRTIAAEAAAEVDLPSRPSPAAYLCVGTVCSAPAIDPGELRDRYEAVTAAQTPR